MRDETSATAAPASKGQPRMTSVARHGNQGLQAEQNTSLGSIPSGWAPMLVGQCVSFSGGGQPPKSTFRFSPRTDYIRLIQIRDYKSNEFETYIPRSMASKWCTENDVMIGRYGPPIFQILRGIDGAYNVALMKATPAPTLDNDYLYHFLQQDSLFRFVELLSRRSSGQTGVDLQGLRRYALPLPPLSEQRAIAAALGDVDALLGALGRLIAKKRDLKQAAMQELLTGRIRLPGFRNKWEVKRIGDVVETDPESLSADVQPDFRFNYIALEDVERGFLRTYSEQTFANSPSRARRKLRDQDILVSTVRPNLQSHLLFQSQTGNWVCSTGFCVLRCPIGLAHPGYVFSQLFSEPITRQIDGLLTGSNYPAINSGDVRSLAMPFPEYREQEALAAVLRDMDAEVLALERRRDKAHGVKQGMMQELLTGRIRLL